MTTSTSAKSAQVTPADSQRICQHMNEDHAVTVYAMARRAFADTLNGENGNRWKLSSDTKLKSVSLQGCTLQGTACSGDLCQRLQAELPFAPPALESKADLRPRLVALHHELMTPQTSWLVTKPAARGIWPTILAMGYGTLVLGIDGMTDLWDHKMSFMGTKIAQTLGSTERLSYVICILFWFSVVAHGLEAVYGWYHCRTTLRLGLKQQLHWALLLAAVGGPVLLELNPLITVATRAEAKKKEAARDDDDDDKKEKDKDKKES